METHTSLFHPDHRLTVVGGGREEVREVDSRRFVVGQIEGKLHPCTMVLAMYILKFNANAVL